MSHMPRKTRIVVLFGGSSPEHDVSVISASQLMDAVDVRHFEVIPVHMGWDNLFRTGASLRDISRYRPLPGGLKLVQFGWGDRGAQMIVEGQEPLPIDCVLPVFHGTYGEDGRVQAYFELLGIPVTGFNALNSALAMRKDLTKMVAKLAGVEVLDQVVIRREDARDAEAAVQAVEAGFGFPVIVKPASLGSSIGVGLAKTAEELRELVASVALQDTHVLIEPQVQNLQEYNIAVRQVGGKVQFSAIERPKSSEELLDFKTKYLPSNGAVKGQSLPSEGMLSLTRDINPEMAAEEQATLLAFAEKVFLSLGGRGAPRMDFMMNTQTRQIWFNEINPIPGSYGFFLWEAAPANPTLFPELVAHLVQEALGDTLKTFEDPVPQAAHLLPR
jgi:D-alanine-D-alanine ligase